ncbi:hypothetical protein MTR67_020091 [Solanum verrucosum]|uniref:Major facilitator superfamily (MFS) profile domain-containing protein n=1 Tax=Solanum verrucosum TaxID=315347 RepID=A0AAF0TNV1_SOLVR|nr:hypothetical protein MTR67_020091 [Solanum verrucosum]
MGVSPSCRRNYRVSLPLFTTSRSPHLAENTRHLFSLPLVLPNFEKLSDLLDLLRRSVMDIIQDIFVPQPSDVPRSANDEEILPEASEIFPLASDTENSGALALQSQSDIKSQPRFIMVVAIGLLATFGGLTIGCAFGVTGGLTGVERFLLKFSRGLHKRQVKATTNIFCAFTSFLLLLFANVVPLSALLSVWPSYRLAHSWGRRPVLICGSALVVLGSLLTAWFPNIIIEFTGLAVTGCGVGFLYQVIPIICHETSIGNAKDCASFDFFYMLICGNTVAKGINLAASGNYIDGWRWSLFAYGIFSFPVFLLSVLLPETPQFLIKQGRVEEAKVVLKRIRRSGAEAELQQLAHVIENEDRKPWQKLLHSPVLVINVAAQIFQRLLGLDSIMFFGPLFLQSIGYKYHAAFLASFLGGAIRAGVAGLAVLSYRFFGRRRTLLFACAGILVSEISLFFVFHGANPVVHLKQQSDYIAIAASILLIGCYSLHSSPRDWTEASYPDDIRALGACCEATVFFFMTLVMNFVTLPLICALHVWVFAFLAVVVICVGFIIYKFLPEIGKKEGELPEAEIWKLHWFWKKVLPKEDSGTRV